MKKVILCTPRSGSTCAVKWLRKKSGFLHTSHEEPFLNGNAIDFLEDEKKRNREYCYKVHIHQIVDNIDWFQSFYTPEEIPIFLVISFIFSIIIFLSLIKSSESEYRNSGWHL